ncbi:hypothetical protein BJ322DRAFT_1163492 [Thelephora terrestris]|uniref:F-box domain-containing protein n=1 Tax=Thelephora terrestris TaxID=56493 RepID=A0A9P6H6U8_9AGAM|nr:hypothetical protein BJ322DRAFT_1163492 [Thelephora terrestris]
MSCFLPPEILDIIVDLLQNEPKTLKACCLVSKAWIYWARRHLFKHSCLTTEDRHTRWWNQPISFVPLHGFPPSITSLHLSFSSFKSSEIFGSVCSLPLLEDLTLEGRDRWNQDAARNAPSTSPTLTGSLELRVGAGIEHITHQLLDLPNDIQPKKIAVQWSVPEGVLSTAKLVSKCSKTLEYLKITNHLEDAPEAMSLDLSKATKLKDVEFFHLGWVALDRLLVQLWTSHSLRIRFAFASHSLRIRFAFASHSLRIRFAFASHSLRIRFAFASHSLRIRFAFASHSLRIRFAFASHSLRIRFAFASHSLRIRFAFASHSLRIRFAFASHSLRTRVMYDWTGAGRDLERDVARFLPESTRGGILDIVDDGPSRSH